MFSFNANTYSSPPARGSAATAPQNYIQNNLGKHSLNKLAHNTNKTAPLVPGTRMRASYLDMPRLQPAPRNLLSVSSSKVARYENAASVSDLRNRSILDLHQPRVTFREVLVTGSIASKLEPAPKRGIRADVKSALWNSREELKDFATNACADAKAIRKGNPTAKTIEKRGIELYLDAPRYQARKAYRRAVIRLQAQALHRKHSPREVTDIIAKWSAAETVDTAAHARSVGEQDRKTAEQAHGITPDCLSTVTLCTKP